MHIKAKKQKCTTCQVCALTCSLSKTGRFSVNDGAIRVKGGLPESFKTGFSFCFQCKQEYCVKACPNGALKRNEAGVVELDESLCDCCQQKFLCVDACRYNAIFINRDRTSVIKCDLCGGQPQCVEVCTQGVLSLSQGGTQKRKA